MRVVAYSLYGQADKYTEGLAENIDLARRHYAGWTVRAYVDVPWRDIRCEQVVMGPSSGHSGMLWRYLAAADPLVEAAIFRDADSRLSRPEAAAVAEWLAGPCVAHSCHHHRHHVIHPLLGGMWGVRRGAFPDMERLIAEWHRAHPRGEWIGDLEFLAGVVWPRVADSCLHHSTHTLPWPARPFPVAWPDGEFMGQQVEADGARINPT